MDETDRESWPAYLDLDQVQTYYKQDRFANIWPAGYSMIQTHFEQKLQLYHFDLKSNKFKRHGFSDPLDIAPANYNGAIRDLFKQLGGNKEISAFTPVFPKQVFIILYKKDKLFGKIIRPDFSGVPSKMNVFAPIVDQTKNDKPVLMYEQYMHDAIRKYNDEHPGKYPAGIDPAEWIIIRNADGRVSLKKTDPDYNIGWVVYSDNSLRGAMMPIRATIRNQSLICIQKYLEGLKSI